MAARLRLAVLVDQTQQLCGALGRAGWTQVGSKRLWGERLRAWCYDYRLESLRALVAALWDGIKPPRPHLPIETSYTLAVSRRCRLQELRLCIGHGLRRPNSRAMPIRKTPAGLWGA